MDASGNSREWASLGDQLAHEHSVIALAPHTRAIFTIQGDIKDTSTCVLDHLGLQQQTFFHAREHATVMVAHWQTHTSGLRTEQDVTGVPHGVSNK
jgi:hypothetical protein